MEYKTRVHVPQVQSLVTAITLYHLRVELSTQDIVSLFGCSEPTARQLKNRARELMRAKDAVNWNPQNVNTICAYESWGLDIDQLERDLLRLRKLGLSDEQEVKA